MKTTCLMVGLALAAGVAAQGADKKLVLIAGRPSHPTGAHEFRAGCLLLQKCLAQVPGLITVVWSNGWPAEPGALEAADAVVIYSDGGGGHPALQANRKQVLGALAQRGAGLGFLHYAVEVPKDNGGPEFLAWIGGFYEHRFSCNPMWAPEFQKFPDHPITRGVQPFSVQDEWYMNIRFRPDMQGITPILVAKPSDKVRDGPYVWPAGPYPHVQANKGRDEVLMWCVERPDGGRGIGWTGGHYHSNWGNPNYRKVVLNALLWLAKVEVPPNGLECQVSLEDLAQNLDPKKN